MNDPLANLLTPPTAIPEVRLRQELFGRTTRALRWRHRWRRVQGIGVLVVAYVAGLLTVAALTPPEEQSVREMRVQAEALPPPTPIDLEWRALDEPDAAEVLYVRAGDGYLAEGDPSNAARCYANALSEGGTAALEVNTNDTWLLLAIKQARKKERDQCVE